MYLISNQYNFIFIHNPKSGGTSIYHALKPYADWICRQSYNLQLCLRIGLFLQESYYFKSFQPHVPAKRMRAKFPKKKWEIALKFGVVRNPYSWLYSYYLYVLKNKKHEEYKKIVAFNSFKDFVMASPQQKIIHSQSFYLTDGKGNVLVDWVLKMENLKNDFAKLLVQLNLPDNIDLPHYNRTFAKKNYRDVYDEEMIKAVQIAFKEDFTNFGYKMTFQD